MDMRIELTQGQCAVVDEDDFGMLSQWKWCAASRKIGGFNAVRGVAIGGGRSIQFKMSRVVMGLPHGDKRVVDHINHDVLDNRKCNLRVCTVAENSRNKTKAIRTRSGFKGVRSRHGRFSAVIQVDGVTIQLGTFSSPESAAMAYDRAAVRYHGEFAFTNKNMGLLTCK